MKLSELQRKPTAEPPSALETPEVPVGGAGQLPHIPGQKLSRPRALTQAERKQLIACGWKDGDPIPPNFARDLQAALADVDEPRTPLPLDTPKLQVPTGVDIKDLPPERRKQLSDSIELARKQADGLGGIAGLSQAGPGVNEAIVTARGGLNKLHIVDDRPKSKASYAEKIRAVQNPSPDEAYPEDSKELEGGGATQRLCANCGHDQNLADDIEITDGDKRAFLVASRGGTRFKKTVVLLGGGMEVTFRALTSEESDMAYRQIVLDGQQDLTDRAAMPTDTYMRNLMIYRLVMAIESVRTREKGLISIPTIDQIEVTEEECPKPHTKLHVFLPAITDEVLATESVRRVIGAAHQRFQLMVEKLEARADDPDFWPAID